jgi:hypothetical protein
MTYTVEQTHALLREAAVYIDSTGSYRVDYVEDLEEEVDGSPYCNVIMTAEEDGEQTIFDITNIDLSEPDVHLYKLTLMNP